MIQHSKTNRSTRSFFNLKIEKKKISSLPPIKTGRNFSSKKVEAKTIIRYNSQSNNNLIKNEIKQMMNYIKNKVSQINTDDVFKPSLVINESLSNKLNKIQIGLKHEIESCFKQNQEKNVTELYREYNSENKDELIIAMTSQIELYKLYYQKLNDLLFIENVWNYRNEIDEKLKCEQLNYEYLFSILSSFDNNSGSIMNNTTPESNDDIPIPIISDNINNFISSINEMKTLYEFLNFEPDDENFKIICQKIKEFFSADNYKIQKILFQLINDKLHIKNDIVSHLHSALNSKDCYEIIENITSIRKILEDYCNEKNQEISKLKEQIEKTEFQLQKIQNENEETKKRVDVFNNKDFKSLFIQIKKENEDFLNKIPQITKKGIEEILGKLKDKTEKCDELKKEVNNLKKEILVINKRNDFESRTPYKKGSDDYYEALQEQMNEMKDSFIDTINELKKNYTNKKVKFQRQIKLLENEKQYSQELQKLLIKRINDINKYFTI